MPNISDSPAVQDVPAAAPAADARFHAARWQDLPGWGRDPARAWWPVFLRNCQAIAARPNPGLPPSAPRTVNEAVWRPVCEAARSTKAAANPQAFIEQHLRPWAVGTASSNGTAVSAMTTGYYEPLVNASRERRGRFQWPLYGVPDDLITVELGELYPELRGKRVRGRLEGRRLVPYDTRAEIESGQRSRPPVIVYTDDPIAAFFLQVQGSGRARLVEGPDAGRTIRLAYADHNGHPYVSIGRWLIERGELRLDQASMQGITAWTQRNPQRLQELLNVNPAMVFFREEALQGDEGPRGSMGVPLTAGRSIAVDPEVIGMGSPIWLATTRPLSNTPLQLLVFAQDTGTAIRGTGRTDYFWGFGAEAGEEAGRMRQAGQQWLLWPAGQTPGRAGQPPG
jgi:membrane-bound lytic murein transglycosylase A